MTAAELLQVEQAMTEPAGWKAETGWGNAGMPLADFTIPGHNDGATVEMLVADAHGAVVMRRHWAALVELVAACERRRDTVCRPRDSVHDGCWAGYHVAGCPVAKADLDVAAALAAVHAVGTDHA